MLENYGFVPLTKEEAMRIQMPSSSGLFSELFNKMKDEIKRNPKNAGLYKDALNMTAGERKISFLNRYFIYKKVRNVDADKLATNLIGQSVNIELDEASALKLQKEKVLTVLPSAANASAANASATNSSATNASASAKKSTVKRPVKQKAKLVLTQEEPEKL
jgi:hypothetical protein